MNKIMKCPNCQKRLAKDRTEDSYRCNRCGKIYLRYCPSRLIDEEGKRIKILAQFIYYPNREADDFTVDSYYPKFSLDCGEMKFRGQEGPEVVLGKYATEISLALTPETAFEKINKMMTFI